MAKGKAKAKGEAPAEAAPVAAATAASAAKAKRARADDAHCPAPRKRPKATKDNNKPAASEENDARPLPGKEDSRDSPSGPGALDEVISRLRGLEREDFPEPCPARIYHPSQPECLLRAIWREHLPADQRADISARMQGDLPYVARADFANDYITQTLHLLLMQQKQLQSHSQQ
ncbi:Hypothetical Protein FCC1311_006202 [Hondaea fermentalgiana]|uniref:Uncharacterized protein n=1 Tax=Hondaea fermentalgiana TaxID=2315210 RepID=A0A2R5G063_9STRA|nr:Hypothetical Protein FCC1311_006202 [Hondaea fermentalgiana]|eukprot:GBG24402.1 Hypothetical Protein FCC1311_006202 [Hondaea fermentalgiana]